MITHAGLAPWFDDLPADIRELLALYGEQGFEDAAAAIFLLSEGGQPPTG